MIFDNQAELKERIELLTRRKAYGNVQIFEDTSSFMSIYGDTVMRLAGNDYFVMGDTKEGRFGISEQPKFWVKYAVDLTTGQKKIVKLVFHEQFNTKVGPIAIRCVRSPEKESQFLDLVRGDNRFMQGIGVTDPVGNLVRIIDFVKGPSFFNHVASLALSHEEYYHEALPDLVRKLIPAIEAMAWVHSQGNHHGDIRNDHLILDAEDGSLVWIDFDFSVNFLDYDIWSMGNLIIYAAAKGITTFRRVHRNAEDFPLSAELDETDASAFYPYRIANLRKIYPYLSKDLNEILMKFSAGATDFYGDLQSQADDLRSVFRL